MVHDPEAIVPYQLTSLSCCVHRPVWREWLDFGIESATMVGWWADKPMLVTGHDQVKATVFIHEGSGLAVRATLGQLSALSIFL